VSAAKAVTDATFEADVLNNDKPVLVDYWAEWCGPCKMIAPVLDAIAEEHGDKIDIVKLNVDDNPQVTQKYGILNIPTLGIFQHGQVVKELVGARSKSALLRELADFI
jgi:thioredoxin 1